MPSVDPLTQRESAHKLVGRKFTLTAVLMHEGPWLVAHCPELGVTSQGESVDEALANLREAVELYLEDEDLDKIEGLYRRPPLVTSFEVNI